MSSDSGRNPIGWRTESNRAADGNRSGGGRNLTGWRVPSRGCTCLKCTDKAIKYPTKLSSTQQNCQVHQQSNQVSNKTVKCTNFLSVVNILAWLVHLRQVHPLKEPPAWLVHLRQVHPLKEPLARLVQFLLWQAAKPSGDKCTP